MNFISCYSASGGTPGTGGVLYVRWGRKTCPGNATLLYTGNYTCNNCCLQTLNSVTFAILFPGNKTSLKMRGIICLNRLFVTQLISSKTGAD